MLHWVRYSIPHTQYLISSWLAKCLRWMYKCSTEWGIHTSHTIPHTFLLAAMFEVNMYMLHWGISEPCYLLNSAWLPCVNSSDLIRVLALSFSTANTSLHITFLKVNVLNAPLREVFHQSHTIPHQFLLGCTLWGECMVLYCLRYSRALILSGLCLPCKTGLESIPQT